MARSIYIASVEGDTGKSTIALGITALLARTVTKVGIFRPVTRVSTGSDYVLSLLLGHDGVDLDYDECVGVTYDDIHADPEAALSRIVTRYHEIARKCDVVVIVGTDYTDVAGPAEFELNAKVAANLGAPVALVVRGFDRSPSDIAEALAQARATMEEHHAKVVAAFANRCNPDEIEAIRAALPEDIGVAALPEEPLLYAPTIGALRDAIDGEMIAGDEALLSREVRTISIAAMTVEHLLDRLEEGGLIIAPGDRADTLLAALTAHSAAGFPALSGIVVNGGFRPTPSVQRLIDGMNPTLPIIATELGTFETAQRCWNTRGRLSRDSVLKVDMALSMFEQHVDGDTVDGSAQPGRHRRGHSPHVRVRTS